MATQLDLTRALRRLRPWVLRYLLVAVPALLLLLMVAVPVFSWFRLPLLVEALETHSLDRMLDLTMRPPAEMGGGPWLALALPMLAVVWLVVQVLLIWIEGGILVTYAQAEVPTGREFARASSRWFGPFLLLALIGTVLAVIVAALVVGVAVLAGGALGSEAIAALVLLILLLAGVRLWLELGRVSAVVRNDRHVFHALRDGARLFGRYAGTVLALGLGSLALRLLLLWMGGLFARSVPWTWWLPTLVLQQVLQAFLILIPLLRKAGEVSLASGIFSAAMVAVPSDG